MLVEIKKAWNGHAKGAKVQIGDEDFDPQVHSTIVDNEDTEKVENEARKASKENAPRANKPFVAMLTDIDEAVSGKASGSVALTVVRPSGLSEVVFISRKFWDKLASRFPVGSYVQISTETRISGTTTYRNEEGKLMFHGKEGQESGIETVGFLGMVKTSEAVFNDSIPANADDIDLITTSPPHATSAMAQYLSATRSARIAKG